MAQVCLITPPSAFLIDERVFVSLGILRVAASLPDVEHLDLNGDAAYEATTETHASGSEATVFGLTATTPQMPQVARIVAALRRARPDARIVLGGPHATLVAAAAKRGVPRATRALDALGALVDIIVAGDGERAILTALEPDAPWLIDADDPKSQWWVREQDGIVPRRDLVDLSTYRYTIDGARATSLVAQLGCLAAGTRIRMADGGERAIESIVPGDRVVCWDGKQETNAPVAAAWSRDAHDLWRLRLSSGETILVTSEHPLWTESGWTRVEDLAPGSRVACLSDVRQDVRANSGICTRAELVLASMSMGLAAGERQPRVLAGWTGGVAGEVGRDVTGRAPQEVEHRDLAGGRKDGSGARDLFGDEAGRPQPDEACGCGRESLADSQGEVGAVLRREDASNVAGWAARAAHAQVERDDSEQTGDRVWPRAGEGCAPIRVRGVRDVLDRAMSVGETSESGLHRQRASSGDPVSRRVLASAGIGRDRDGGLRSEGLDGACGLVEGTSSKGTCAPDRQTAGVRYATVVEKTWLGTSRVYNITVCPGHAYIANGIAVHNCPFECSFCGGRFSPMLRRIRTRSTDAVVEEVRSLAGMGFDGLMFYDDELNVNRGLVGLMDAIAPLGLKLRGFIKAELFTDEQAAAMARAGFRWILVGFESGSPRILTNINKKATVEDNDRCIEIARRHGLKVKALMSIGHAGESAETVEETRAWLLRVRPDDFDCTIISTYPGTPYYDEAKPGDGCWTYTNAKTGDRLHSQDVDYLAESEFYKGRVGQYKSHVHTDHLTAAEIVALRDELEVGVRSALNIPFAPGALYESSMGQVTIAAPA